MIPHVSQGGDISPLHSAANWNMIADTVNDRQRSGRMGRGLRTANFSKGNPCVVQVRNDTGEDLVLGSVVQIYELLLTGVDPDHLWFLATKPTDYWATMAILLQPLPSGAIGPAALSGVCIGSVVLNSTQHWYAKWVPGYTDLETCDYGPVRLVLRPPETGYGLGPVILQNPGLEIHHGMVSGDGLDKGDSGIVFRYVPGTQSISEYEDTVWNFWADIGADKEIAYAGVGDRYVVLVGECPLK